MTSPEDHVVPPTNSDHLAATLGGPVERVTLERSYHVATIDFDKRPHHRAHGRDFVSQVGSGSGGGTGPGA